MKNNKNKPLPESVLDFFKEQEQREREIEEIVFKPRNKKISETSDAELEAEIKQLHDNPSLDNTMKMLNLTVQASDNDADLERVQAIIRKLGFDL